MKRMAMLTLVLVFAFPSGATATGSARIQHPDGSVNRYSGVHIAIKGKTMSVTSADGVGRIIIERAGCVSVDKLLRCNPYEAELRQHGETLPIRIAESTAWLNPSKQTETLPLSSTRLVPNGIVMTMRTKNGTYLSLDGVVDSVKK